MDKTDKILEQLQMISANVISMDKKIDSLDERMDSMEQRMDSMEQKMDRMENDLQGLKNNMATLIYANTSLSQELVNLNHQIAINSYDIVQLRAAK